MVSLTRAPRWRVLVATLALGMTGAGVVHGVARVVAEWQSYTWQQWRLMLRADEQMRIKAALGPDCFVWYRAVADIRRDEAGLWVFAGLTNSQLIRVLREPSLCEPRLIPALVAVYQLRRVLFPMPVHALPSDAEPPAAGCTVLVLDLTDGGALRFPGHERASVIGKGARYGLYRLEAR